MTLAADFRDAARHNDGWACVHQGAWERLLTRVEEMEVELAELRPDVMAMQTRIGDLLARDALGGAS